MEPGSLRGGLGGGRADLVDGAQAGGQLLLLFYVVISICIDQLLMQWNPYLDNDVPQYKYYSLG